MNHLLSLIDSIIIYDEYILIETTIVFNIKSEKNIF